MARQKHFYERALFNSTFAIQEQMEVGRDTYDFPAVYFIGLMDFTLHEGSERVLFRYDLREQTSGELITGRIQYIFLELPNCRAVTPESTVLEKFCYALHNLETLPGKPEGFEGELFRLLFETAEIATFTPQEKIRLENDMRTERDIRNQIAYARESGVEEGLEEGRLREEARIQSIAAKLREKGISEDEIAAILAN